MHRPELNKKLVGDVLEDFFGLGMSIKEIASNRKISECSVSKYLNFRFGKKLGENTVTIQIQSKINRKSTINNQ